ncbi:MAG TPA: radical SAM protein [Dehalococcoidales bacterium]
MFFEPFEQGPIRPPSEAYSLLIRATRNCPWNRCRFCSTYKGNKFELRPVEEIKQDILKVKQIQDEIKALTLRQGYGINVRPAVLAVLRNPPSQAHYNVALWMQSGSQNVFLQDANSIIMRTPDLVEVLKFLKETLPTVNRITSYGRSHTAAHKTPDELKAIHEAGLSRLHIGLESGSDTILKIMNKGVTAEQHIAGGQNVVASGISLSEYVLLGLGGQGLWHEHALETARVLSAINPDFIRIRTLGIYPGLEMYADVESGAFVRQSDEGMVEELRLIIENLDCTSNLVSDHSGNLLEEVTGKLPEDKSKMLGIIAQYQSLPPQERLHFRVGRRAGVYVSLDEMKDPRKRATVAGIIDRLSNGTGEVDDDLVHQMRLAYT